MKIVLPLFALLISLTGGQQASGAGIAERDVYGAWPGLKFEKTGFFHLATDSAGRWWMVSPEGNAYLADQMDHMELRILQGDYNRAFWAQKFGISSDAPNADWLPGYQAKVKQDMKAIGFNAVHGVRLPGLPYIKGFTNIRNSYWEKNPKPEDLKDVFSEKFAQSVDQRAAKEVASLTDDPWLIGWHFTDSPVLWDYEALPQNPGFYHKPLPGTVTYPQRLRNLGPEAAGKQAYVNLMKRRYVDVAAFNDTYCTDFKSLDELLAARNWKPLNDYLGNFREEADNRAFLLEILDKAYTVQVAAVKKYDSNHLIFGDRLNCNAPLDDEVIRLFGKYFDVLSFQFYGTWEDFRPLLERLHKQSGRPVHSADSSFAVANKNMPNPLGIVCANQRVRSEQFKECYYQAYALPYFIGWGWCGWIDSWPSLEPGMQHSGVQDAFGNHDQPIVDEMKRFSEGMYQVHLGR